ncbi:MAG: dNTP triphosphohydrolase [Clostridia bacterium]|nr:dNTP triphosphohydrolase [Clostridia bacterium]
MKKKLEEVAMFENNPKWENSISRVYDMYEPIYKDRSEFDRDYTRIINCNAYRRLKHKTQVFFSPKNDHICTRLEHVNHVESISNSIANYLGLNSELTRTIAVSHDLGHSPFGHKGEEILSEISEREFGERFWHGWNGKHLVDDLELLQDVDNVSKNLNLTYAVRDGILGHCGSPRVSGQKPRDEFVDLNEFTHSNKFYPYTWEGCVVKIADNISYLGRDLEDAIEMKLITRRDINSIDRSIEKIRLNNTSIIGYLVKDLCENSTLEDGLKFSDEAYGIMEKIRQFNYKKIYNNEKIQPTIRYFKVLMNEIFYTLKKEYAGMNTIDNIYKLNRYYPELSDGFSGWLEKYTNSDKKDTEKYDNKVVYDLNNEKDYYRAIIDYIAGMTDQYVVRIYSELISF